MGISLSNKTKNSKLSNYAKDLLWVKIEPNLNNQGYFLPMDQNLHLILINRLIWEEEEEEELMHIL